MTIRTRFVVSIAAVIVVLGVAGAWFAQVTVRSMIAAQEARAEQGTEQAIQNRLDQKVRGYDQLVDRLTQTALEEAALFSRIEPVQEAYALALSGDISDEADPKAQEARQNLRKAIKPFIEGYLAQTGRSEFKLHFHLPNGHSLARLWRDGWQTKRNGKKIDVSDDISPFRRSVMDINSGSDHTPIRGIEVGRGGFALRGLSPITGPDGKHLGSNEVLLPFNPLLDDMKTTDGEAYAVYMDASLLSIATKLQDPEKHPILDGKFVFCASTDQELVSSLVNTDLLAKGMQQTTNVVSGQYRLSCFPVRDYSGKPVGTLVAVIDASEQLAQLAAAEREANATLASLQMKIMAGFTAAGVFLLGLVYWIGTIVVVRPVKDVTARVRDIAEGEGDLTKRIEIRRKDEIGELAKWFNAFVGKVHEIISEVAIATGEVSGAATEIAASSDEMARGIDQQASQTAQVSAAVEELSASVQEVAAKGTDAVQAAEQAGVQAEGGGHIVAQTVTGIDGIANVVNETGNAISELGRQAEQIGDVIEVINDIADQTNLLALNAAIEAARAGEHGRGFAVVADEVRKLAERTTQATTQVGQTIGAIQEQTGQAVDRMSTGTERVDEGVRLAQQAGSSLEQIVAGTTHVAEVIQTIAATSDEQSAATEQIAQNIEQINALSREAAEGAAQAAQAAASLSAKSEHLQSLVGRFKL